MPLPFAPHASPYSFEAQLVVVDFLGKVRSAIARVIEMIVADDRQLGIDYVVHGMFQGEFSMLQLDHA